MDGVWVVCEECGALVAEQEKHELWHAAVRQEAVTDE